MSAIRVLITEDSFDLQVEMVDFLNLSGFYAEGANSIAAMKEKLNAADWQILLLDLNLPDGDGVEAAQWVRAQHGLNTGIVMVTARGQVDDRIRGIRSGADAYLVKPVDLQELVAVITNLASRIPTNTSAANTGWLLDTQRFLLITPGARETSLTAAECEILRALMHRPQSPLSREQLCRVLPPCGDEYHTRRLDSLISRLRTKVENNTREELPLKTFRNKGYAFTGEVLEQP
ncbi:MAG: response regulator transcription factor [Marinobacter sp.]|nr:response regulator transcription factor [Marinobacter sp.]